MASELNVQKATVLGGGSFGTAVANILAENGFQVCLWMRNETTISEIISTRENKKVPSWRRVTRQYCPYQ